MKKITKGFIALAVVVCLAFGTFGVYKVVVPDKPTMPVASQMSDVDDP